MNDVVKNYPRPSADLIGRFENQQAATIHEAMGKRGAFDTSFRPAWFGAHVCGAALTIDSRAGDNLLLHKAVSMANPGDVLVVKVDGFKDAGMWGEILTVAAMQKGIKGLVIDGGVRDTIPIREIDFPMFSKAISMKGTTKTTPGTINHPIVVGGVVVNPGDIVVGDNDGVVVIPLQEAEEVLAASIAREENEAKIMERIRNGESTMDILGFQAAYDKLNLTED